MKRFFQAAGVVLALVAGLHLALPSAVAAPPQLNRGTQAYDFGALVNLTTAVTTTTDAFELYEIEGISVHEKNGNIVGTLVLQASNDGVDFFTLSDATFDAISGTGGQVKEWGNLRSRYYRLVYTHSSGTGLLKILVFAKGK